MLSAYERNEIRNNLEYDIASRGQAELFSAALNTLDDNEHRLADGVYLGWIDSLAQVSRALQPVINPTPAQLVTPLVK